MEETQISIEVRKVIVLDAPPRAVFKALTDPKELVKWFPEDASIDPKVGGEYRFKTRWGEHGPVTVHGKIVELVPNKLLTYTWVSEQGTAESDGLVTWKLDQLPSGKTSVTMMHTGNPGKSQSEADAAWGIFLGQLENHVATVAPSTSADFGGGARPAPKVAKPMTLAGAGRGAIATVTLVVVVGLLMGAGVVYVAAPSLGLGSTITESGGTNIITVTTSISNAKASGLCNGQTITIGALNDLSGFLSTQGKGDLAAEQIAINEVNNLVNSSGCRLTFKLGSYDYSLNGSMALSELQSMQAAGVKVVVGPLDTGAVSAILAYANSNHIVLISPSSTSPLLHVTDTTSNYLFRTAPNDAAQGQAIAREVLTNRAKAAIIINRNETYGSALASATTSFLIQDGMSQSEIGGPFTYGLTTADFSSLIAQVTNEYNALNTGAAAGHVAIISFSFQELGTLLQQASTQSPTLYNDAPWYGSDSEAQNLLLTPSPVGQYTSHVVLPSTLFNVVNNSKTIAFYQKYAGTPQLAAIIGGGAFYTMGGYDDVWLAALSIMAAGQNIGKAIHDAFVQVANSFYGLTGWEGLSGNDRIPSSEQIWKVIPTGSGGSWVLAGTWDYATDSVTWISPP